MLRGYRLTTGYVGFFPAVRHPIGGELSLQLSGTRWKFTPEGFRRPALGGVERARLIDDRGQQVIGRVQLTADRPGHLAASVRAGGPAILAFTERFHDGLDGDGRTVDRSRSSASSTTSSAAASTLASSRSSSGSRRAASATA